MQQAEIFIEYNGKRLAGKFLKGNGHANSSIWERLQTKFIAVRDAIVTDDEIEAPWPNILDSLREYGSAKLQKSLNFRFIPQNDAISKIKNFAAQIAEIKRSHEYLPTFLSDTEINQFLEQKGFTRKLRSFQIRDLQKLMSLSNGANFSVPGAGKTTVTIALNLLTKEPGDHLFVVAPKAAFPAWKGIISECFSHDTSKSDWEEFTVLDGSEFENQNKLQSGATKFLISYDMMVRHQVFISNYFLQQRVHLVLDESHRIKSGLASQRGAFLINVSSLPIRRDILSGTPMPQSPNDMASQLKFLWPGSGLDLEISKGVAPRTILENKYVRTTKKELGLPPLNRYFYDIDMEPGQLALYSIVQNEVLRQLANSLKKASNIDIVSARKSVMRLLQLSVNPLLALHGMVKDNQKFDSGIIDEIIKEGKSSKMKAVEKHVRRLVNEGKKVLIWTIFTGSIIDLENSLADLNPVSIYGSTPNGHESEEGTREYKIARFHNDDRCKIFIANPAAAGEGISLHKVCHDAIYLDRSYVSTHYLQSIDRIHRLGLAPDIKTNIHIYRTKTPVGIGSIDISVSRRLTAKIRNLQELLDDEDLHEIAFDEENSSDPTDYDIDIQDLIDLIAELEGKASDNDNEI